MRLTVPLNPESLAFWTGLTSAAGRRPGSVTLPGDPRRYLVASVEPHHDVDPDAARLDVRLVEYVAPVAACAG